MSGPRVVAQPDDPYASYAFKWDGEWQITYETFRDMGIAYGVGLLLIYLLVVAHLERPEERGEGYETTHYSATLTVYVPAVCPCCGA